MVLQHEYRNFDGQHILDQVMYKRHLYVFNWLHSHGVPGRYGALRRHGQPRQSAGNSQLPNEDKRPPSHNATGLSASQTLRQQMELAGQLGTCRDERPGTQVAHELTGALMLVQLPSLHFHLV